MDALVEPPPGLASTLTPTVREAVRRLLLSSEAFRALAPEQRRAAAQAMVRVCDTAAALLSEEAAMDAHVASSAAAPPPAHRPVAMAQATAGQAYSGVATDRLAGTTRAILNAVSFPRFVTELINGVFKALVDSNQQQMSSYVELIGNVASSVDGFADANLAPVQARRWLVDRFPGSFTLDGDSSGGGDGSDTSDGSDGPQLRMRDGAAMPPEGALRAGLGLGPNESIPSGDPETALLPFARRALAQQRQQMLASMVMLGMQRIVIESGRLNAAMRFHIDTRSAATADEGSRFDEQNKVDASVGFKVGPWGVDAKMTNTIGYVSTQQTQTTEATNTELDLNSSVELYFKTDYLPLERLAGAGQVDRIRVNTLNPDAEERAALQARGQRIQNEVAAETSRRGELDRMLQPGGGAPASQAPAPRPNPPAAAGGAGGAAASPAAAGGATGTAGPRPASGGSVPAAPSGPPAQGRSPAPAH
jgi:hypothetical protein